MACSSRDPSEGGFALVAALLLALIYLGLILVVLAESSLANLEASRFRARTVAGIYAENGIELGWLGAAGPGSIELEHGESSGTIEWLPGNRFRLEGRGSYRGSQRQLRVVTVSGRVLEEGVVVETIGERQP